MARARKQSVLVLCHDSLVPPPDAKPYSLGKPPLWRTEFDVSRALRYLRHEVRIVGVQHDFDELLRAIREFEPDLVFNLLVEFHARPEYDQHVASLLELMQLPYTGCNPRGLTLARDKGLSKQILADHGVDVPEFQVFPRGDATQRREGLEFPLIVKSRTEEASLGLARTSIVNSDRALTRRVRFVHEKLETDAIAEEYLDGRELYSGLIDGTARPRVLPTRELRFEKLPPGHARIATRQIKFSPATQKRLGIWSCDAELDDKLERRVARTARRAWEALGLEGYARVDLRLTESGRLAVLEANPNPELARHEDFAEAAASAGIGYPALIQALLDAALRRHRELV